MEWRCAAAENARTYRQIDAERFASIEFDDIIADFKFHGGTGVIEELEMNSLGLREHCVYGYMNAGGCSESSRRRKQRDGNDGGRERVETFHG